MGFNNCRWIYFIFLSFLILIKKHLIILSQTSSIYYWPWIRNVNRYKTKLTLLFELTIQVQYHDDVDDDDVNDVNHDQTC